MLSSYLQRLACCPCREGIYFLLFCFSTSWNEFVTFLLFYEISLWTILLQNLCKAFLLLIIPHLWCSCWHNVLHKNNARECVCLCVFECAHTLQLTVLIILLKILMIWYDHSTNYCLVSLILSVVMHIKNNFE